MEKLSALENKRVLIVDDEPDIIDALEEQIEMCLIDKATSYEKGIELLLSYTYDIVILDIMGVNGFELLKASVNRGFPTVMLTAHALTPEALKKSIKLGAVYFLPKEKIHEMASCLVDVVSGSGKPMWQSVFSKLGTFFDKRFGVNWKEKDKFFKDFMEEFRNE